MATNRRKYQIISQTAERRTAAMAKRFASLLREDVDEAAQAIRDGKDAVQVLRAHTAIREQALADMKMRWALAYAVEGWNLAGLAMGKKSHVSLGAKALTPEVDTSLFGADELVANHLKPRIGDWVLDTSKIETETTASDIERLIKKATAELDSQGYEYGPMDLAKMFLDEGIAATKGRAMLLSRTMTIWNYNEGAVGLYESEGIGASQWLTTDDDVTCEFCREMDNKIAPLRKPYASPGETLQGDEGGEMEFDYDVMHAPLHPHCRCTIVPVTEWIE